jgi:cell division protein FtsB
MTARRGSLRFKVKQFARAPLGRAGASSTWYKRLGSATRFASRLVVGALILALVGAFGAQMWRVAADNYRLHRQISTVESQNEALVADSARLQREIVLLHDPDYLVPLIHEQLGLVKPHEVFIVISPTPTPGK